MRKDFSTASKQAKRSGYLNYWTETATKPCRRDSTGESAKKQAAHKVQLLEVSGVLLVVLVQLLQPARGGARQRGPCRGRTSTSTSASVLRRRVGVASEY